MRNLEILNDHSTIMMNLKACEQNPSLKHSMLRYATQQRHTAGCLYISFHSNVPWPQQRVRLTRFGRGRSASNQNPCVPGDMD